MKHARMFNIGMAIASHRVDERTVREGVPGTYVIRGSIHRMLGPMEAREGQQPRNLQTYFYDADEQCQHRARTFLNDPDYPDSNFERNARIFHMLREAMIERKNSYLQSFQSVKEFIEGNVLPVHDLYFEIYAEERPGNN